MVGSDAVSQSSGTVVVRRSRSASWRGRPLGNLSTQQFTQTSNFQPEGRQFYPQLAILLLQHRRANRYLLLLGAPGVPRPLGRFVVLPPSLPVVRVLRRGCVRAAEGAFAAGVGGGRGEAGGLL